MELLYHLLSVIGLLLLFFHANHAQSGGKGDLQSIQTMVYQAQMGTKEEKVIAMKDLVFSAINPDQQELLLNSGALPVFVKLLQSGTLETKFSACQAIGALTTHESVRIQIGQSKAIENLHELLSDPADTLKVAALQTLGNLMQDVANQQRLIGIGGVSELTELLAGGSDQMRRIAAGTIGNIGMYPDHVAAILAAGAVPKLVDLLRANPVDRRDPLTVEVAVGALRNIAQIDLPLQAMLDADALAVLDALQTDTSSTSDTKDLAAELTEFLLEYQNTITGSDNIFDEL